MNKWYKIVVDVIVLFIFFWSCKKDTTTPCNAVQGDWELVN